MEDSNSNACRTSIVDIIRIATNVMCIIQEDYRIPHVEHGGVRSPAQSTVAQPPSVQHPTYLDLPSVQTSTSLDLPSIQPPISLDLSSV